MADALHIRIMPEKHPKRPRDLNQWGKRMIDIATGEVDDREPTPEEQGKDWRYPDSVVDPDVSSSPKILESVRRQLRVAHRPKSPFISPPPVGRGEAVARSRRRLPADGSQVG